jgi:hypothetical protein
VELLIIFAVIWLLSQIDHRKTPRPSGSSSAIGCSYAGCSVRTMQGGRYCYLHTCMHKGCRNLAPYGKYCDVHAVSTLQPDRNTPVSRPLRQKPSQERRCFSEDCLNEVPEGTAFCRECQVQFVARHCGKKRRYSDEHQAHKVVDRMEQQTSEQFEAYRCKVCSSFHVGHRRH